jgi:hypothetical protein
MGSPTESADLRDVHLISRTDCPKELLKAGALGSVAMDAEFRDHVLSLDPRPK